MSPMTRIWLSITVEMVSGRGERFWPRPGRVFVASRAHTFPALAEAIDDGESQPPADTGGRDLPPLLHGWR